MPFEFFRKPIEKKIKERNLEDSITSFIEEAKIDISVAKNIAQSIMKEIKALEKYDTTEIINIIRNTVKSFKDIEDDKKDDVINTLIIKKKNEQGEKQEEPRISLRKKLEGYFGYKEVKKDDKEYLENEIDEEEIITWIESYAYILLSEDERKKLSEQKQTKQEYERLKSSFNAIIGARSTQNKSLNILGFRIHKDLETEPGEFIQEFLSYFDDIAKGGTKVIFIKSTTFEKFPEIIKRTPEKFGIQKLENGDYEIHITRKQVLETLKSFIESQKETAASQGAWRRMEEKIYKAKGLKERFRLAFIEDIGPGEETDKEIVKTIEIMIRLAEQIMEKTGESGLSEEEHKIVKEIVNKVDEAIRIREEKQPEWEKKLYEWAKKAPKEISKKLLEGGKNLASLLGTGFLLWGAVFAFYLPVLIADYAQKKAGDFIK